MPHEATQKDADGVEFVFKALGYGHLRARAVADHVLIETGTVELPISGIRLRKISRENWRVEMFIDSRWRKTPNVGPRGNMVAALCDAFNQQKLGNG